MKAYQNISCAFYDFLVLIYTRKKVVRIQYYNLDQATLEIEDSIRNIYSKESAEYLQTQEGIIIRLDYLIAVDNRQMKDSVDCQF